MTTLMEEEPYAAAVNNEHISDTCTKCFAWNSEDFEKVKLSRCAGCLKLYYCSAKCQKEDWKDHKAECKLFRSAGFIPTVDARLVMRMLVKSKKQPDFKAYNGRTYDSLMHLSAKLRENSEYMTEARAVYAEISRFMGSKAPDFETVFLALSKKVINAFKIHDSTWGCGPIGIGLYLGLSVLDHSCRPDAFIVNQGSKMMLRTAKEGCVYSDKLTISYCVGNFFLDTSPRRNELLNSYFFFCKCDECEDIESNEERTSGRPVCCPNSWFSIDDRVCNKCNKEVSSELAEKAKNAMQHLRLAHSHFTSLVDMGGERALPVLARVWIKLSDSCKEVLSDENTCLFYIANKIYISMPQTDLMIACKYVDLSATYARKIPHCVYGAMIFIRRFQYYVMAKKPLQEMWEALNEALASAQVVFGPEHDLTKKLLEKKILLGIANLNLH